MKFLIQNPELLKDFLNIKEVSIYGVLIIVIILLIYDRKTLKKEVKEKDDKIYKVIEDHQNDLKESNKDFQAMSEKWSVVFSQLKEIIKTKS